MWMNINYVVHTHTHTHAQSRERLSSVWSIIITFQLYDFPLSSTFDELVSAFVWTDLSMSALYIETVHESFFSAVMK